MVGIRLSPSKIVLYDKCQRKFWYRYVKGLPEPQTESTVRGTLFHKVLEDFYNFIDATQMQKIHWEELAKKFQAIMIHLMETEWTNLKPEERKLFGEKENELKEQTRDFVKFTAVKEAYRMYNFMNNNDPENQWFSFNFERDFKPVSKEEYIAFDDIHGFLDKTINVYGKGTGIVDYKTGQNPLPHTIEKGHLLQLKTYAYLYKRKNNKLPLHLSIYYAKNGESVYYEPKEDDIKEVERIIKEIKEKQEKEENFPKTVTKLCEYCHFKDMCKPFQEKNGLQSSKL